MKRWYIWQLLSSNNHIGFINNIKRHVHSLCSKNESNFCGKKKGKKHFIKNKTKQNLKLILVWSFRSRYWHTRYSYDGHRSSSSDNLYLVRTFVVAMSWKRNSFGVVWVCGTTERRSVVSLCWIWKSQLSSFISEQVLWCIHVMQNKLNTTNKWGSVCFDVFIMSHFRDTNTLKHASLSSSIFSNFLVTLEDQANNGSHFARHSVPSFVASLVYDCFHVTHALGCVA